MKSSAIILTATLVVVVILIIYAIVRDPAWTRKSYWLAHFVDTPWRVYQRSDGTFDEAAQIALRRATERDNPTPMDNLLAATIITRNIIGQEHRPARTAAGAPTRAATERAHLRRDMYNQARDHYIAALDGLRRPAGRRPPGERLLTQETEAILDAATEFAFMGAEALMDNDPVIAMLLNETDWELPGIALVRRPGGFMRVDQPIAARATLLREDVTNARQAAAREAASEQGGARGIAADTYVTLATQNTSNAQNVHDHSVLACLKGIVERLRAEQGPIETVPTLDAVIADIRANGDQLSRFRPESDARPHLVADAVAVAERTREGERVVSVGATDEECLRRVWLRADDPRNAAVRASMRQAVFDGLVDSWEDDGIIGRRIMCVNGRTGHILGSLVMLDHDKRNWVVKRLEQFKNDIFAGAREVIDQVAQTAAESGAAEEQKAGRMFLAKTAAEIRAIGPVSDGATEKLTEEMRVAIGEMVDAYIANVEKELGAVDIIPAGIVDAVRLEAQAAAVA